ncbi:Gfo/Idh/MocA family oxidoreductase [Psychrobacillus sp. FSL H8-0483]|uniref:Gfo/Idh/MocA family oxidoreductase n=1 Tax=Psychrobacillus sp. FSL H8-0483 TaxID=2921389 RepID=UPI00315AD2F5
MKSVAIIGAGQLGSRHLQGITKYKNELNIYIVDPFEESLEISKQRFLEVNSHENKRLISLQSIVGLPQELDFVIISTNSKQRLQALRELLNNSHVKYLLLEKFLFPLIDEYDEALSLIRENGVNTYVNCARRMWPNYQELRDVLFNEKNIKLEVQGSNWNLGSNSIHFLDLFFYLTGESNVNIDISGLDDDILENKRPGYIEFSGTLKVISESGHQLNLTSVINSSLESKIKIQWNERVINISEQKQEINIDGTINKFPVYYQSELTNKVFEQLIQTGACSLVPFERAVQDHLILLKAFNDFQGDRVGEIT